MNIELCNIWGLFKLRPYSHTLFILLIDFGVMEKGYVGSIWKQYLVGNLVVAQ